MKRLNWTKIRDAEYRSMQSRWENEKSEPKRGSGNQICGMRKNAYGEETDREGENADHEKYEEREDVAERVPDGGGGCAVESLGGRHWRPNWAPKRERKREEVCVSSESQCVTHGGLYLKKSLLEPRGKTSLC